VDTFDGRTATPTLDVLDDYDAVILIVNNAYADPVGVGNVLADYVDMGGGVIMTLASFIGGWDVRGRFASDGYFPFTLGTGPLSGSILGSFDASHPIMKDVTTATGELLGATSVAPGAVWVADWTNSEPFVATQGDHVVGINIFVADGGYWTGDIPLVLCNAVLWASGASAWLSVEPKEGVVPAGGSTDLAVKFDAEGQFGGDYSSDILIANNDPLNSLVTVPAQLHVTGAPDLGLSETSIDYGPVFIGGAVPHTITLSNEGTDQLFVTGISSSHGDYTADISSVSLAPNESQDVVVTFAPTTVAPILGTLAITSNDPDQPVLEVDLAGEGVLPPIISVTPDSIWDDLFTGETSMHTITISNSGASNLEFEIGSEEMEALGAAVAVSQRIRIPRSSGDFERGSTPPSMGPAPRAGGAEPRAAAGGGSDGLVGEGPLAMTGSAFSTDAAYYQATRFNLSVPEVLNFIGPANDYIWAGDFGMGDNAFAYAVNNLNQFMRIDTLGGAQTVLGTITPFGSEIWTGMALDPTDGTMYATSTNVSASSLYRIDVEAVTATRIGAIGFAGIIALAVDKQGDMWSHDIVSDQLVSIDKTTGVGTAVGSLGFDANFGQGMAFDPASDQLYLAAFNNSSFQAELRVADRTTGATALLGVLGATSPGGIVQLGWLGIPGLGGARWLSMDPTEGIVPPGAFMDIGVTVDAEGLFGGDYDAHIVISNNDPLDPEVRVPAHLHVTGAPDIAVSETLVDWGQVFVGAAIPHTITISNPGTDVLDVTSIASSHGDFTTDLPAVTLAAHTSQGVVLTFAPTTVAPILGTLTITSNDPDEPVVEIELRGEGLEAPIISVSPDSIADDLFTGESSDHTLSISNTGGNDLVWKARTGAVEVGVGQVYTLTKTRAGSIDPDGGNNAPPGPAQTAPITATLSDLTDVHILWEMSHGGFGSVDWSVILSDVMARGATVTENFDPITPELLGGYDLIWVTDFFENWSTPELDAVADWVNAGGAIIFESDQAQALINEILSGFDSGITYLSTAVGAGTTTAIFPHATTQDVTAVYMSGPLASLEVMAPAGRLVDDSDGLHAVAYSEVGGGRIVAVSDEIFGDWSISQNDNQLFGNQIVDWLAAGVGWLKLSPAEGTVAPGASQDVTVTFDATGLYGGDYDAHVIIANNDPLDPEVLVPAHLHVTGAPDIEVSETAIDWGPVFIGAAIPHAITVSNPGTDVLDVTGIVSNHGDFTVDLSSLVLAPGESQDVIVTFAPTTAAPIAATLTVTSNDPDEGTIEIALQGEGLVPPVISVEPESLSADLFSGGKSTQQLTITNTGGSDLAFNVSVEVTSSPGGAASASSGDPGAGVAGGGPVEASSAGDPSAGAFAVSAGDPGTGVATVTQGPTPNRTAPTTDPPVIAAEYSGDHLRFGLTTHGEIMPFQYPIGNEHLRLGSYVSGYTLAYRIGGVDHVTYAYYDQRFGITPVSYTELTNDPMRVVVEVITQTVDGQLSIVQRFTFDRSDKFIGIKTTVQNTSPGVVEDVVFKYGADWDVDSEFGNNWNYDSDPHMVYAWETRYTAIASAREPEVMDAYGWNDFTTRQTVVDYPVGPVLDFDGLEIMHLEVGDLAAGSAWNNSAAYAAGDDLNDLRRALRGGLMEWLVVEPSSGVVPPGGSAVLDVTFDAEGLIGGDYDGRLIVENNDPLAPAVPVPAHMHVTGAPDIALSDTMLDFGTMFVGASVARVIIVENHGTDELVVSGISSGYPDVSFNPLSFTIPVNGSQNVTVTLTPSSPGGVADSLTITSNDPDEGEARVHFVATALVPPDISVSPDSLVEALFSGETSTQILTIGNPGGSPLSFSIAAYPAAASEGPSSVAGVASEASDSSGGGGEEDGQAVSWLTFSPTLGNLNPAESREIIVGFNAVALVGGVYHASLVITTNVPAKPAVSVPIELTVTGVPSIAVSDTILDFGAVFIGYTKTKQFVVSNLGSEVLVVSDISADLPSFTATPASFNLAPLGAKAVSVDYTPASPGAVTGLLTISSNDPDTPAVELDLEAEALLPPVLSVSPASIEVTLGEGEVEVDSITVSNAGGSDLDWNAEIVIPASMIAEGDRGPQLAEPLAALQVLWHGDHGWGGIAWWSTIVSYLTSHGAVVTESSAPIDSALLEGFDVIWFGNRETPFAAGELEAIVLWTNAGGHVLIEADTDGSRLVYNELLAALGSGIGYFPLVGVGGNTPYIHPHETTVGVDEIYLISPQKILSVLAPAGALVDDAFERTVIAYDVIGDGRLIVISDHTFHDLAINSADNKTFAIQVFEWFGASRWLSLAPSFGTLGPAEMVFVEATINASFLTPGEYELDAVIHSNDPATPSFTVPVTLTVTAGGSATGIDPDEIPSRFELHANHPNPFNPSTAIAYDLPKASKVRLVIYDVSGREIRVLADADEEPGRRIATWDGRNARGETVASGVYFYRLNAGDFVQTRKMVFLK
jgi:hypothetical protein